MAIFDEKIEIRERCKGVHCVDLGESFPTSIYLHKSASIQPRTSPSKFGVKFNLIFICLLNELQPMRSSALTREVGPFPAEANATPIEVCVRRQRLSLTKADR